MFYIILFVAYSYLNLCNIVKYNYLYSFIAMLLSIFIVSYIVSNIDSYIVSFIAMLQTILIAILPADAVSVNKQPFFNS